MIRELFVRVCMVVVLCVSTLFVGCTKNEYIVAPDSPEIPEEKSPTYTVMLYGVGGGNLDNYFDYNLGQLTAAGKQERVNFRALFKYSQGLQSDEQRKGTRLLTLTENDGLKNEKKYESTYRMDNPAHLTDFIKETKELMPADKYILIFWNHGSEFSAADKLVQDSYLEEPASGNATSSNKQSRAVLFDDNVRDTPALSVFEMAKGIQDSDTKLDLLYIDACNMGMIENYAQLKDLTHFMMAAYQPTPGMGGNYAQLQFSLQNTSTIEDAIKDYVPKCVNGWKNTTKNLCDLECYDMTCMDEFLGYTQKALDCYMQLMEPSNKSEQNILEKRFLEQNSIYDDGYSYFADGNGVSADLCFTLNSFQQKQISGSYSSIDGSFSAYLMQMDDCLKKMTVAAETINLPKELDRVSMGINWPTIKHTKLAANNEKFQEAYRNTYFDQLTHWSNRLFKYKNETVEGYPSCIFVGNNGLFPSIDITHYVLVTNGAEKFIYDYEVEWYFDDKDLTEGKKEEAHAFLDKINKQYEKLGEQVLPLAYTSELIPELRDVVMKTPLLETFKKYASKVYVKIKKELTFDTDGEDPDLAKYPLEQTVTIDYAGA